MTTRIIRREFLKQTALGSAAGAVVGRGGLAGPALSASSFKDTFANWDFIENSRGIKLATKHHRVPLVPDVRLSPENLNYGLPERVGREYRDKMMHVKATLPGRFQVGQFETPRDLITTWTVNAPYLRKPYFPNLIRLQSGSLLAFYSEGKGHGDFYPYGRGVMVRSDDGGRSWSSPVPVPNEAGSAHLGFGCSACQTRDGTIWVTVNKGSDRSLLMSHDDGRTWRMFRLLGDWKDLDPVGEMSNGEFLWVGFVYVPCQPSDAVRNGKVWIHSTGILKNWEGRDPTQWIWEVRVHRDVGFYDESTIAETRTPGHLVYIRRSDRLSNYYLQSDSYDYGRTWSASRSSGIWESYDGSRPHLINLPDGTLVCAYGAREMGRVGACFSFDEGHTWNYRDHLLALDSPGYLMGDYAYCKVARLSHDKVFLIYYNAYNLDPKKIGLWGQFLDTSELQNHRRGVELEFSNHPPLHTMTRGYWNFEEKEGRVLHEALDREHGLLFGATRARGRLGRGLKFDGRGAYAAIADHPSIQVDNAFTLEAWIYTFDSMRDQAILSKRPRYYFGLEDGKLAFAYEGKPHARGKQTLEAQRWYHVAVVCKPNPDSSWLPRISFFVDGKLDAVGKQNFQLTHNSQEYASFMGRNDWHIGHGPRFRAVSTPQAGPIAWLYIGIDSDGKSRPFSGMIDEVAVHGEALTDEDIDQHANRRFMESGELTSVPIVLPKGKHWDRFQAGVDLPTGTSVEFDIVDMQGRVIESKIQPGASLAVLNQKSIRLRARFSSGDLMQTPVLRTWAITFG